MPNTNYDHKYVELLKPITIYSKTDARFLKRIRNQVLKDPNRKAYIRHSISKPNKWTVYADISHEYDSLGYKNIYDESQIIGV